MSGPIDTVSVYPLGDPACSSVPSVKQEELAGVQGWPAQQPQQPQQQADGGEEQPGQQQWVTHQGPGTPSKGGAAKDPDRFYCPYPGCNRSFAELWRLKVHYRAPPDIRGSGKERGHGTELTHCPKCNKTLKPGKHHVGCSASKATPRVKRKPSEASLGGGAAKASRSAGEGEPQQPGPPHGMMPGYLPQPPPGAAGMWPHQPMDPSLSMDGSMMMPGAPRHPPTLAHPGHMAQQHDPSMYWQNHGAPYPPSMGYHAGVKPDAAPVLGLPYGQPHPMGMHPPMGPGPAPPGPGPAAAPSLGYASSMQSSYMAAPTPLSPASSAGPGMIPHAQPPHHAMAHGQPPHMPMQPGAYGGFSLPPLQPQPQPQPPPQQRPQQPHLEPHEPHVPSLSNTPATSGLESSDPECLANIFDDEEVHPQPVRQRAPSPPPLPEDFYSTALAPPAPNRMLFNFSQFSQKMPHSLHEVHAPELTDNEVSDLAAQHVVFDQTDDGELMQMLFGMADDMPTMATIHLHTWRQTDADDGPPGPPQRVSNNAGSRGGQPQQQQQQQQQQLPQHLQQQQQRQQGGAPKATGGGSGGGSSMQQPSSQPVQQQQQQQQQQECGDDLLLPVDGSHGEQLGDANLLPLQPNEAPREAGGQVATGSADTGQPDSSGGNGRNNEVGQMMNGGEFMHKHHVDLLGTCGDERDHMLDADLHQMLQSVE